MVSGLTQIEDGKRTIAFYSVYTKSGSSFINAILEQEPVLDLAFDIALASSIVRVVKEKVEGKPISFREGKNIPWKDLDMETIKNLAKKGGIIVVGRGVGICKPYVSAITYIEKDKEIVYDVVSDFDNYDKFMPMVDNIKTLSKIDNTSIVDYHLSMNLLVSKKKVWYRLRHKYFKPERISWDLDKGDMDAIEGGWDFLSMGKAETLGIYSFCSTVRSMGFLMELILNKFPQIETGIQVATGATVTNSIKDWIEKRRTMKKERKSKRRENINTV